MNIYEWALLAFSLVYVGVLGLHVRALRRQVRDILWQIEEPSPVGSPGDSAALAARLEKDRERTGAAIHLPITIAGLKEERS